MAISMTLDTVRGANNNDQAVLRITSHGTMLSVWRAEGQAPLRLIDEKIPLVNGTAVYSNMPPQKTLITYVVQNDLGERSAPRTTVMPIGYSLARPCLNGDIVLGDMVFNTVDDDGTVWTVSDVDGWWTTPQAIIPTSLRASDEDGDYDSDGRYDTRVMTFEGSFLPASPAHLTAARERLVESINAVRRTQFLIMYDEEPKYLNVRLTGRPLIETVRPSGLTNFSVGLRAADPTKKSVRRTVTTLSTGAGAGGRPYPRVYPKMYGDLGAPNSRKINNSGNYPAFPIVEVYGPAEKIRVENITTGGYTELNLSLLAGQIITIDMRNKTVLLQGAVSRRAAVSVGSTWWQLAPGDNEIRYGAFTNGVESQAKIYTRSTWIG